MAILVVVGAVGRHHWLLLVCGVAYGGYLERGMARWSGDDGMHSAGTAHLLLIESGSVVVM